MKDRISKIISGGQTGADRAALDFAVDAGIPHGGYVPAGRRAEDGKIPDSYRLVELDTKSYPARTEKNILESDGTLIASTGRLDGGSALTLRLCSRYNKPCLCINLSATDPQEAAKRLLAWMDEHDIRVLNVAGPRESKAPGIYRAVYSFLSAALGEKRAKSPDTRR